MSKKWFSLILTLCVSLSLQAEKRIALIIGNSSYQSEKWQNLSQPVNDAKDIAEQLSILGFEITDTLYNAGRSEITKAMNKFEEASKDAQVAVIYYSGHGISDDSFTYIVPTDANNSYLGFDEANYYSIQSIKNKFRRGNPKGVKILIFDACRTIADYGESDNTKSGNIVQPVLDEDYDKNWAAGEIYYYSSSLDRKSSAGSGSDRNSLFTESILSHINDSVEFRKLMQRVKDEVVEKSHRKQVPSSEGAYTGNLYFNRLKAAAHEEYILDNIGYHLEDLGNGRVRCQYDDGSLYIGEWKNNKKNGKGIFYSADGDTIDGTFVNGKAEGKIVVRAKQGYLFNGQFRNGKNNGYGVLHFGDQKYEGNWENGMRSGYGVLTSKAGDTLKCNWVDDSPEGNAVRISTNYKISGQCRKGKFNGICTVETPSSIYVGELSNDEKIGMGKETLLKTGVVYEGEFNNGVFAGKGKITYPDGRAYEGIFTNGELDGEAVYYALDGNKYPGIMQSNKWTGETYEKDNYGNIFKGFLKDGVPDGKGEMIFANKISYKGDFKGGHFYGKGEQVFPNGSKFDGEWVNDTLVAGNVFIKYDDGTYTGSYVNGKKQGKGVATSLSGARYEGDFFENMFDGTGILIQADGSVYEGQFRQGKMEGNGTMKHPNGSIITGLFSNDNFVQGNAKIVYNDGSIYEGEIIKNGLKHGKGKYTSQTISYEGDFRNDLPSGKGISIRFVDSIRYEGEFKDGQIHGKGKYIYPNGDIWEGENVNGLMVGLYTITYPSGDVAKTLFENGSPTYPVTCKHPDGSEEVGTLSEGKFIPD